MKIFVRNDNRLYNMTKQQRTFLCINDRLQKSYKSLAKKLQKLQGCNKYLPLGARPVSTGQVRVYVLSGAPVSVYTSKGATPKRSVAAVGATTLDY